MQINKTSLFYFSATNTTKKIVKLLLSDYGGSVDSFDLTNKLLKTEIIFEKNDLVVVGVPVYSGRIPQLLMRSLKNIRGNNTPAIISVVYGNRDYDDSLLELKDLLTQQGFKIISAAAFVAQHSIMPGVATGRPDEKDVEVIKNFARKSFSYLSSLDNPLSIADIKIAGNRPYKAIKPIPVRPVGDKTCNKCGICVKLCPAGAISLNDPRLTDRVLCISCARCVAVCPMGSRQFRGLLYKIASWKFTRDNSARKEPELFFCG